MYGTPFTRPGRNTVGLRPRPYLSEESAIESRPAQVMQQTSDLILANAVPFMTQGKGDGRAHAGGPYGMRSVIPANHAASVKRMGKS